jgi:uncharacterized protein YqeY
LVIKEDINSLKYNSISFLPLKIINTKTGKMSLTEQINADLKSAMKNKEKEKLEAIRAIKTAFTLAKTEKGSGAELTEDEELKIIQKLVKQRKDSAEIFKGQGRDDLYEKEVSEAKVISVYMPEQLCEEELAAKLAEIISKVGASGPQDMGKVMGMATKELSGKAEGKLIAQKVKELLSK